MFWQRVTEGLAVQQLWQQFSSEARSSYELYVKEVNLEPKAGEKGGHRPLRIARALFWAMMLKLSPARRVAFLISLVFVLLALINLSPFGWPREFMILLAAGSQLLLLALELADRVIMKRDLEIAREIQHWLVPATPPQIPGVDIAFATRPANTVAGDYYDAFVRGAKGESSSTNRLLLVVADVAGKSVPAALLMATFQASLRTLADAPTSLVELVHGLNGYACAHSLGGRRFTTAFLAELNLETGALIYVNAGHNPPVLCHASGEIERLQAGGLPLGILRRDYQQGTTALGRNDLLVVFTDGVVEAENGRQEEFGERPLLDLARSSPEGSAGSFLKSLMAALDVFVGGTRQHDDVTCLVLRMIGRKEADVSKSGYRA